MRRASVVAGGLLVAGLWVYAVSRLALSPPWLEMGELLSRDVRLRPGVWRLLRGGLHHVALPTLAVGAVVLALAAWRRDRHSACLFVAGVVATNLVVQGMKHGQVVAPPGANPLSGHVGVAAGIGLCWLATPDGPGGGGRAGPAARRLGATLLAVGMPVAVLLTGWHTLAQVLVPLGVATGCAVVVGAVGQGPVPLRGGAVGCTLLGLGVLGGGLALWSAREWDVQATHHPASAALLAISLTGAAAVCAVALVVLSGARRR